jgi:hypothetical protein
MKNTLIALALVTAAFIALALKIRADATLHIGDKVRINQQGEYYGYQGKIIGVTAAGWVIVSCPGVTITIEPVYVEKL